MLASLIIQDVSDAAVSVGNAFVDGYNAAAQLATDIYNAAKDTFTDRKCHVSLVLINSRQHGRTSVVVDVADERSTHCPNR